MKKIALLFAITWAVLFHLPSHASAAVPVAPLSAVIGDAIAPELVHGAPWYHCHPRRGFCHVGRGFGPRWNRGWGGHRHRWGGRGWRRGGFGHHRGRWGGRRGRW